MGVYFGGGTSRAGSGGGGGANSAAGFGFLSSFWRNRERCRAKAVDETHWSACDKRGRSNGEKESEVHSSLVS